MKSNENIYFENQNDILLYSKKMFFYPYPRIENAEENI